MSRCFSYPPPGYSGIQGSSQTLIESIKLQRGSVLAKAETKKDRKKEKKERKKEKKVNSKACLLPEKSICKPISTGLKYASLQKLIQSENEQLERSSLTEEHAQPVGEQKPSTSSDSTQNSSKRKRESSPPAVVRQAENSIHSNGNVIRIKLSSQKQKASVSRQPCSTTSGRTELPSYVQDAVVSRQEPCSTSGRTECPTRNNNLGGQVELPSIRKRISNVISVRLRRPEVDKVSHASGTQAVNTDDKASVISEFPNKFPQGALPPRPDGEGCSTSEGPTSTTRDGDVAVRDPKSLNKKLVKAELRYRDLLLNWVPPPLQTEPESDDQDWLFGKKKNTDNPIEKKLKPSPNVCCLSSSALWPSAQFIPEADIYALPFTVPF